MSVFACHVHRDQAGDSGAYFDCLRKNTTIVIRSLLSLLGLVMILREPKRTFYLRHQFYGTLISTSMQTSYQRHDHILYHCQDFPLLAINVLSYVAIHYSKVQTRKCILHWIIYLPGCNWIREHTATINYENIDDLLCLYWPNIDVKRKMPFISNTRRSGSNQQSWRIKIYSSCASVSLRSENLVEVLGILRWQKTTYYFELYLLAIRI